MKLLDADTSVRYYRHEPFAIKLETGKRYIPDFHVIYMAGDEKLLEIKPKMKLSDPVVQNKEKAGKEFCKEKGWDYQFLTLEDIQEYEKSLLPLDG